MAASTVSDSEEREIRASSKKRDEKHESSADEVEDNIDGEGGDDEDDEEEYEIEAILNAKKGRFEPNEWAYFVKWKGYDDPKDNSWVRESDAGNARELIDHYWVEKDKAKKAPRKSETAKPRGRPRKSSTAESPEPSPAPKKRGRKSKVEDDDASEREEKSEPVSKKYKKSGVKDSQSTEPEDAMDVDEGKIVDARHMKKYMDKPSWEDMVVIVDTVERSLTNSKDLTVYFKLSNKYGGERVRLPSSICNSKFPQKMLAFYEQHLKWKETEVDDE